MNFLKLMAGNAELTAFEKLFDFDFGLNDQLQTLVNKAIEFVCVLFVLIILWKIINLFTKGLNKRLTKKKVDKTLTKVTTYLLNKGLKILVFITAVACIGIDTTSIVGLFTATGLGVGLAVQGALSNFAGGVIIIFVKPFKVDDYIEAQGMSGTVTDIKIFYTYLTTPDNKVIMVPNGSLVNGAIINYSAKPTRRLDIPVTIDYDSDVFKAESIIQEVVSAHANVLKTPEPTIRVADWQDSAILITCRVWVESANYWDVRFDLLEQLLVALVEGGIKIPYNQIELSYRKDSE